MHVAHPLAEMGAAQFTQLFDQFLPRLVGHRTGEQEAVYQHVEFRLRELMLIVQVRINNVLFLLSGLLIRMGPDHLPETDVIVRVDQVGHIPLDGRPVDLDPVVVQQLVRNLLLRHGMVHIRVFLQDVQNIQDNDLLPAVQWHMRFSPFLPVPPARPLHLTGHRPKNQGKALRRIACGIF